jgi:uncharacterized membrane protein
VVTAVNRGETPNDPPRQTAERAAGPGGTQISLLTIRRVVLVLAASLLLWGPVQSSSLGMRFTWAGWIFLACFLGTGVFASLALATRRESTLRRVELALLGLIALMLLAWGYLALYYQRSPATDEEVFIQHAATLLRNGVNPYTANLSFGSASDHLGAAYYTPLLDGGNSTHLDYPPGAVLLVLAASHFVHTLPVISLLNIGALVATGILLYFMLPDPLRMLGPVAVASPILLDHGTSGLSQVLMIPLFVIAGYRWNAVGRDGRLGRGGVTRAVALGLAASIQQLAWFVVPFLLVGTYLCRRDGLGRRAAAWLVARYAAVAAGAFLVVNIYFIIWNPSAWFSGVMAPLTQHAVPMGDGTIALLFDLGIGGGNLMWYSVAMALGFLALFVVYTLYFRRMAPTCFVLSTLPLTLSSRSLATYIVTVIPVWLVTVATASTQEFVGVREPLPRLAARNRLIVAGGVIALLFGSTTYAVAQPQPFTVRVLHGIASSKIVSGITLRLTNTTGQALTPRFMTSTPTWYQSPYWQVIEGPATLPAHTTADYVLAPADARAWSGTASNYAYRVEVVTANPYTVSMSQLVSALS